MHSACRVALPSCCLQRQMLLPAAWPCPPVADGGLQPRGPALLLLPGGCGSGRCSTQVLMAVVVVAMAMVMVAMAVATPSAPSHASLLAVVVARQMLALVAVAAARQLAVARQMLREVAVL